MLRFVIYSLLFLACAPKALTADAVPPPEAIQLIIQGNDHNYTQFHSVRGKLTESILRSRDLLNRRNTANVATKGKDTRHTIDVLPNPAEQFVSENFLITEQRQRYEGGVFGNAISIVEPEKYTVYKPNEKHASVYERTQSSLAWRDPRQLIFVREIDTLEDLLTITNVRSASLIQTSDGPRLELEVQIPNQYMWLMDFDPARHYLPTKAIQLRDADTMVRYHDVLYEEVAGQPNRVWFPTDARQFVYLVQKQRNQNPNDNWAIKTSYHIDGLEINVPVQEADFTVSFAPGTVIADAVAGTASTTPDARWQISTWIMITAFMVFGLTLVFAWWLRRRSGGMTG